VHGTTPSVHRKDEKFIHHKSRQQLFDKNSALIAMFAANEWRYLAEATRMPFQHAAERDKWDIKWKARFESILDDKVISNVE
jgi:hypothetical protein